MVRYNLWAICCRPVIVSMQAKKKSFTKVPARLKRTLLSTKLLQEGGASAIQELLGT